MLGALRSELSIQRSEQRVYFQFAGMTRETAEALSAKMRSLGWKIPFLGEERTAAAAGLSEVRYSPALERDRLAAELLAADLTQIGQRVTTRPVSLLASGQLEIWVSI